jgi:hypothetical protein
MIASIRSRVARGASVLEYGLESAVAKMGIAYFERTQRAFKFFFSAEGSAG